MNPHARNAALIFFGAWLFWTVGLSSINAQVKSDVDTRVPDTTEMKAAPLGIDDAGLLARLRPHFRQMIADEISQVGQDLEREPDGRKGSPLFAVAFAGAVFSAVKWAAARIFEVCFIAFLTDRWLWITIGLIVIAGLVELRIRRAAK